MTGAAASISCVSSRSPMSIILWTFSPSRRWIIPGNPRLLRCKRCSPARPSTCGRSPAGELNPGSLGCDRLSANDSRGHGFVHGPALPASFHDVPRFLLDVSIVASAPCSIEVARLAKVSRWRHQACKLLPAPSSWPGVSSSSFGSRPESWLTRTVRPILLEGV